MEEHSSLYHHSEATNLSSLPGLTLVSEHMLSSLPRLTLVSERMLTTPCSVMTPTGCVVFSCDSSIPICVSIHHQASLDSVSKHPCIVLDDCNTRKALLFIVQLVPLEMVGSNGPIEDNNSASKLYCTVYSVTCSSLFTLISQEAITRRIIDKKIQSDMFEQIDIVNKMKSVSIELVACDRTVHKSDSHSTILIRSSTAPHPSQRDFSRLENNDFPVGSACSVQAHAISPEANIASIYHRSSTRYLNCAFESVNKWINILVCILMLAVGTVGGISKHILTTNKIFIFGTCRRRNSYGVRILLVAALFAG